MPGPGCLVMSLLLSLALFADETPAPHAPPAKPNKGRVEFGDFGAFWIGGKLFLERTNNLDAQNVAAREQQEGIVDTSVIWYPPWMYPVFVPYALMPFRIGAVAWVMTQLALLLLAAVLLGNRLGMPLIQSVVLGMLFPPAIVCLGISQLAIMVLAGAVLFWEADRRGHPFLAGVALALCSIKPHLVSLLWILMMLTGSWRARLLRLVGLTATIALLFAGTLAWYPDLLANYVDAIRHPPQVPLTNYFAATLGMWLRMLSPWPESRLLQFVPWLVAVGLILLVGLRSQGKWREATTYAQWEWALSLSILVLPYGWHYDQVVLLPLWFRLVQGLIEGVHRETGGVRSLLSPRRGAVALLTAVFFLGYLGMIGGGMPERWYALWPLWLVVTGLVAGESHGAATGLEHGAATGSGHGTGGD